MQQNDRFQHDHRVRLGCICGKESDPIIVRWNDEACKVEKEHWEAFWESEYENVPSPGLESIKKNVTSLWDSKMAYRGIPGLLEDVPQELLFNIVHGGLK